MAGSHQKRWIMRQAMIELCTESERGLVDQFLQAEATSRSDDAFTSGSGRLVWSFIVAKALAGEVELTGHLMGGAETIVATGLLANSHPNFHKQTLKTDGGTFSGVLVGSVIGIEPNLNKPVSGNSGPDPRHEDEVIQEMLRFALTPDGFESRRQLENHMKSWCSQTMGDKSPSARTIERWVKRYCPPELSTK